MPFTRAIVTSLWNNSAKYKYKEHFDQSQNVPYSSICDDFNLQENAVNATINLHLTWGNSQKRGGNQASTTGSACITKICKAKS
jgi:hypothetical protein